MTHDQSEALAIADEVAVVRNGRIEQAGSRATSTSVRRRASWPASSAARTSSRESSRARLATATQCGQSKGWCSAGTTPCSTPARPSLSSSGLEHVLLELGPNGAAPDGWHGVVVAHAYLGDAVEHVVALDGLELRARSAPDRVFAPGTEVAIAFADGRCSIVHAACLASSSRSSASPWAYPGSSTPLSASECRRRLADGLQRREERFVDTVERGIYGTP